VKIAYPKPIQCPLCQSQQQSIYQQDKKRDYWQCTRCQLVFVAKAQQLSATAEKAEYDKHQNDVNDQGYRQFLGRAFNPLLARLKQQQANSTYAYHDYFSRLRGLDFGCGPGPTLSHMAKEQGVTVANYDLYYFNQPKLLERSYDFICLTEVIEHIAEPKTLLQQLEHMLKAKGLLVVMTKRVIDKQAFSQWHYKNDPTHISFYSEACFKWISQKMQWQMQLVDKDVVIFTKA
jgi:2-polyprenyl-3-methyl-5-hydroxy-6-metoxy-1,4-benzoquinol methylase